MGKTYTGRGDDGTTARFGGERMSKSSLLPRVTGALDETNAALGLAATLSTDPDVTKRIEALQHTLFRVGADLATPQDHPAPKARRILSDDTRALEQMTDALDADLPELRHFILPGGTPVAAALHLARASIRRTERELVALFDAGEALNPELKVYMNRLSSYLFALARAANARAGKTEKHPEY